MKKKLKISINAPVILWFSMFCLAATILNYITGGLANKYVFSTYRSSIFNPLTYIRMFTHVAGHSGWGHLMGNMAYILLLGPMLEEKYGSPKMIGIMAVTAFVTSLVNSLLFPNTALCGASGIVFAFILMMSFTGFKEGEIPLTFILVAVIYIGGQIVEGVTQRDNISNLTHIVGGIVGSMLGYTLNRRPVTKNQK